MHIARKLADICAQNITIAVAESCTAGLLSSRIASIPGSSNYFKGGIIAYKNQIKIDFLGVSESLIKKRTAVSEEVVIHMASYIRQQFSVDYAVAISGYTGPTGGNKENPIGTVYISVASKFNILVERFNFKGERSSVATEAVEQALSLLYNQIKDKK